MTRIDEDRLLAYAHGELDPAEAAELEAALENDAGARALVADWKAQDAALATLLGPVADQPVPPRLTAAVRPAMPGWLRAAAMLATLAIGLASGWTAARLGAVDAPTPALAETAIAAHETYVVEVAHPVEVAADDEAHLVGWLSKRLGTAIRPPDFAAHGFHLIGGRVLPDKGDKAAAMMMYEDDLGRRLSLYVIATPEAGETAFRFTAEDGVQSFWWTDGGLSCAVVGSVPRDLLRAIAVEAYDQLI